ncbi:MAG: putative selenate reductase subunit YgfK [Bacteroidota bacterium]
MSDRFSIVSITQLYHLATCRTSELLGIPEEIIATAKQTEKLKSTFMGKPIDSPVGVAAGPHTQMAQNLIAAYLCGARYLELKTVQTLDELNVSKPCIDMQDEGYNVEWSQELRIRESFEEYLKAWIILHLLHHKAGIAGKPGFIFNMSVGYNMEGILKENVQWFFGKMKNCKAEKEAMIQELLPLYPALSGINIPDCMSDSITLSTMHGCPPEEIEKIGLYLINEMKLNTLIKLNPTLLGPEKLRTILNKVHGHTAVVPDEAFGHDLKYPDALRIINNLTAAAKTQKVFFGLKLTNTLETMNNRDVFTPNEKMMYMSGRALHPISINLANVLQKEYDGKLNISFSAGADCFNIPDVISCGLFPVTVCSDVLKPGGYGRLHQYITALNEALEAKQMASLDLLKGIDEKARQTDIMENLAAYADKVLSEKAYAKDLFKVPYIKTGRKLNTFDCIGAPCVNTCPTNQDIPVYMYHAANGDFEKAFRVIMHTNPFPAVCGMVCDHLCQTKCTRVNYDNSLLIREVKRYIAENAGTPALKPQKSNGKKAVVIGAGPSGLAAAYFLAMAGFSVEVFETKSIAGGMVSDAIPSFRLSEQAIMSDIERIKSIGVKINYNHPITKEIFEQLRKDNNFIYVAIGAQKAKKLGIAGEEAQGVLDPLKFLSSIRRGVAQPVGKNIVVIGGGNTAMDVARTAKRLAGADAKVTIVYRRTIMEMPADKEEVISAQKEGLNILELVAPESVVAQNGHVTGLLCSKMELGEKDSSGRRKPVKIAGSEFELHVDTIIPALGQDIIADFVDAGLLQANEGSYETQIPGVFIGGDAMRGPATIIKAIGDGRIAAEAIIAASGTSAVDPELFPVKGKSYAEHITKRSLRQFGKEVHEDLPTAKDPFKLVSHTLTKEETIAEASRCLYCDEVCSICVTVCPNRANNTYEVEPFSLTIYNAERDTNGKVTITDNELFEIKQSTQVLNIAEFCNECGNCTTFCPTSGRPFMDKPKFCLTESCFAETENAYFLDKSTGTPILVYRNENSTARLSEFDEHYIYEGSGVKVQLSKTGLKIQDINFTGVNTYSTLHAIELMILMQTAKKIYV